MGDEVLEYEEVIDYAGDGKKNKVAFFNSTKK